jgi:ketosteroid isomerase-like protein
MQTEEAPDLGTLKTEIQAMEDAYAAGQNAKDVNAIMPYYSNDAVSFTNNDVAAIGAEAIAKRIQADLDLNTTKKTSTFKVQDIFVDGNLLVETGSSETKDSTGTVISTGKYMSLFEKRDGKYVCIRDIYNEDKKE